MGLVNTLPGLNPDPGNRNVISLCFSIFGKPLLGDAGRTWDSGASLTFLFSPKNPPPNLPLAHRLLTNDLSNRVSRPEKLLSRPRISTHSSNIELPGLSIKFQRIVAEFLPSLFFPMTSKFFLTIDANCTQGSVKGAEKARRERWWQRARGARDSRAEFAQKCRAEWRPSRCSCLNSSRVGQLKTDSFIS